MHRGFVPGRGDMAASLCGSWLYLSRDLQHLSAPQSIKSLAGSLHMATWQERRANSNNAPSLAGRSVYLVCAAHSNSYRTINTMQTTNRVQPNINQQCLHTTIIHTCQSELVSPHTAVFATKRTSDPRGSFPLGQCSVPPNLALNCNRAQLATLLQQLTSKSTDTASMLCCSSRSASYWDELSGSGRRSRRRATSTRRVEWMSSSARVALTVGGCVN